MVASALPAPLIHNLVLLPAPLQQAGILHFTPQDLADAAALNEFAVEPRYEPSFTSADLLEMADRFRTKLRPRAQAFLI